MKPLSRAGFCTAALLACLPARGVDARPIRAMLTLTMEPLTDFQNFAWAVAGIAVWIGAIALNFAS